MKSYKAANFVPLLKESEETFLDIPYPNSSNGINDSVALDETKISHELLHTALKLNDIQEVRKCIEFVNLNLLDKNGKTLLDYAISNNVNNMYDLLASHGAKTSLELLFSAVKLNNIEEMREYIEFANLNFLDKKGKTILDYASSNTDADMYKLLESNGAKISREISSQSKLQLLANVSSRDRGRISGFKPAKGQDLSPGSEKPSIGKINKGPRI